MKLLLAPFLSLEEGFASTSYPRISSLVEMKHWNAFVSCRWTCGASGNPVFKSLIFLIDLETRQLYWDLYPWLFVIMTHFCCFLVLTWHVMVLLDL